MISEKFVELRALHLVRLEQRVDRVFKERYALESVCWHFESVAYLLGPLQILAHSSLVHGQGELVAAVALALERDPSVLLPTLGAPQLLPSQTLETALDVWQQVPSDDPVNDIGCVHSPDLDAERYLCFELVIHSLQGGVGAHCWTV